MAHPGYLKGILSGNVFSMVTTDAFNYLNESSEQYSSAQAKFY